MERKFTFIITRSKIARKRQMLLTLQAAYKFKKMKATLPESALILFLQQ
jgi:hypothetical protein